MRHVKRPNLSVRLLSHSPEGTDPPRSKPHHHELPHVSSLPFPPLFSPSPGPRRTPVSRSFTSQAALLLDESDASRPLGRRARGKARLGRRVSLGRRALQQWGIAGDGSRSGSGFAIGDRQGRRVCRRRSVKDAIQGTCKVHHHRDFRESRQVRITCARARRTAVSRCEGMKT